MGLIGRIVKSIAARPAARPASASESVAPRPALDQGFDDLAAGRLASALSIARAGAANDPADRRAGYLAAATLMHWGRRREALAWFRRIPPGGDDALAIALGQGAAALDGGSAEEAERILAHACRIAPASVEAAVAHLRALIALGRVDDALVQGDAALARLGRHPSLLAAIAHADQRSGRFDRAEAHLRDGLAAGGGAALWHQLAQAYAAQDRLDEALEAMEHVRRSGEALAADAFAAIAHLKRMQGHYGEAIAILRAELPSRPHANSQHLYGETLLALGHYRAGWRQFEFRWLHEALVGKRVAYGRPAWNGQDLAGRTVLVQAEQGIGDVVMFARYLPLLKQRGARVLFVPRLDMDRVARRLPGVDQVLADGEALPAFDYVAHLMGLPRVFGTTLATIPARVPYLDADAQRAAAWRERLAGDGGPKVGLVWGGRPTQARNHLRSIPLRALLPVLRVPGIRFYSLQKGPAEAEIAQLPPGISLTHLGDRFDDLEDLVAAMAHMDLIVSVCTGPAHIAGAMGKPVWTLISEPPDLRWLTERDDSPWYPTMRLFRQHRPGQWDRAVEQVASELARGPSAWAPLAARQGDATAEASIVRDGDTGDDAFDAGFAQLAETRQGLLMFDPGDTLAGRSIEHYGEWLHARLELALRWVRAGGVVVEIDAGIGMNAVALGRALGPAGELIVYERRAALRRMLAQNFAANGIANATLMSRDLGGPAAGGFTAEHETLDDLGLDRLDGVFVDTAIDAASIVDGAAATLWRCRPWMIVAVADEGALGALAARVREFGYRTWRMETPLFSPANFNGRDDDVFDGRSALALVALPEETDLRDPLPGCVESR